MECTPDRFAIRVKGRLAGTVLAAFPELRCESHGSDTVLTGEVRDPSELYGVLARLEALSLELIDVQRLPSAAVSRPTPVDGSARHHARKGV
jgi:hypothetical protein